MFETRAVREGFDGAGFDQQVAHTIGEKIEIDQSQMFLTIQ
jgi:hypothetical protein